MTTTRNSSSETTHARPAAAAHAAASRALALSAVAGLLLAGCGGGGGGGSSPKATLPLIGAATFTNPAMLDNPLWSFPADTSFTYASEDSDDPETIVVERVPGTRTVMGLACAIVRDRVYADGLLIEDTEDWYAQDDAGNVWYMGESALNYDYDENGVLLSTDTEGSWEAGLDPLGTGAVASPGIAIHDTPAVGDFYYQEFYEDVAEDTGKVLGLDEPADLGDGSSYQCVQIQDANPLEKNSKEHKFYAPGVGLVVEQKPNGEERIEYRGQFVQDPSSQPSFGAAVFSAPGVIDHPVLPMTTDLAQVYISVLDPEDDEAELETIAVKREPGVRTVAGVDCAIVRDRVYVDGLLIEDTEDWFAQDDDGNVWYMGEFVINYDYDENGALLGTDNDGSWEAGLDVAGVGSIADPGYQMPAMPAVGQAYYQEFYPTEAEDMGRVVATDVTVDLPDGSVHTNCVRVLDWNPLEPDALEYKSFAPGEGLVLEEGLHDGEAVALYGTFDRSAASIPDFASALFTTSTLVDNPLLPLPMGATWEYESETDDGTETVVITVHMQTRVVAGVTCLDVQDQAFLDGVLIEDTHDWFAQDDDGNVWYFGEEVVNYVYDQNGVLLGTNMDGSWEAGLDIAGVGSIAQAGIQMLAAPTPGAVYYQEFYATEAEDMGRVVATDASVKIPGYPSFDNCVQVLDWNPLDGDGLEYKFYAPGIGLVLEQIVGDDEELALTDTSL